MQKQRIALLVLAAVVLIGVSAGAATYFTKENLENKNTVTTTHKKTTAKNNVAWDSERQTTQPAQQPVRQVAQTRCDDGNIAGKVVGGVGGGVVGSMIGKGNGKTAATIGGTLGGAYLGGEAIPLRNVTCR